MINNFPKISVALASFNGANYIEEQLNSILKQTIPPYEIVISDDHSSDNTIRLITQFQIEYDNIRLIVSSDRKGVVKNFENAFRNCKGEYIAFSDQDDVWLPNKLEKSYGLMQKTENDFGTQTPCLVFTDLFVVDEALNQIAPSYLQAKRLKASNAELSNILVENICTGCTMLMNKALVDKVPVFPSQVVMHDMFVAMVASSFGQITYLNEPTVFYRQHQSNVMGLSKNSFKIIVKNTISVFLDKKSKDNFLAKEITQAEAFYNIYNVQLPEKIRKLLLGFITLKSKNKLVRVSFLVKNNILKGNLLRNFNLILKV